MSTPVKLIGESITFAKKAIGGFGGTMGGFSRGGTEKYYEMLNGSG